MKNKIKRFFDNRIYRVIPFIVLLVVIMSIFCSPAVAYAETISSYEDTNVWDDLTAEGTQIAGVDFDIEDYPWNENGRPQIIDLVEFGYSYFSDEQDDYGLYIYVYNPSCLQFDENSNYNKVQMTWGSYGQYRKFTLEFLNYSNEAGYEGLFWKFKINISNTISESNFLKYLSNSARTYTISGIELSINGEITEYAASSYKTTEAVYNYDEDTNTVSVGSTFLYDSSDETEYDSDSNLLVTYTYSGYALGYGSSYQTESSLVCSVDNYANYLSLDVHQTTYRENGDYHDGDQSQLNSCYFSIPNSYLENYGVLSAVLAEWYEYLTKPVLVTEKSTYYNAIQGLYGQSLIKDSYLSDYLNGTISDAGNESKNLGSSGDYDYLFVGIGTTTKYLYGAMGGTYGSVLSWTSNKLAMIGYSYDYWTGGTMHYFSSSNYFPSFAGAIYTNGVDYTEYTVSTSFVQELFYTNSQYLAALGYDLDICGKYSSQLFEDYIDQTYDGESYNTTPHAMGYNCISITDEDVVKTWTTEDYQTTWQKITGGRTVATDWTELTALQEVDYNDYKSYKSAGTLSATYKIGSTELDDFEDYVEYANDNDETVFVLHYGASNYSSIKTSQSRSAAESGVSRKLANDWMDQWENSNYSAYYAKQTVYLNFDIISLTFTAEDGSETVVPVVMSPQDVFSSFTSPLVENTGSGIDWEAIVRAFLILLLVVIICVLFAPVIPYIVKAVLWIITAPFKLIAGVYKGIKNSVNKNKRE